MKSTENRSAFFHTLVVVGAGIATACGGQAQDGRGSNGDGDGDGDGDQAGDGDANPAVGGGTVGSGGGTIDLGSGGTGTGGAVWMGGELNHSCSEKQLDCGIRGFGCELGNEAYAGCGCDDDRPLKAADCPAGTVMTCLNVEVSITTEDAVVRGDWAIQCSCVEEQVACDEHCSDEWSIGYPEFCDDEPEHFEGILCGCEIPILR